MESALVQLEFGVFLILVLFGWWAPAFVFYASGLILLGSARRRPAMIWSAVFVGCLAYTLFDGIWRKHQFEQRAQVYRDLVRFQAAVPGEPRRILIAGERSKCEQDCLALLLGGKFDEVIVGTQDISPRPFNDDPVRIQAARTRGLNHYYTYRLGADDDCKRSWDKKIYREMRGRDATGRCMVQTESYTIEGPRFEYLRGDLAPDNPPWPVSVQHVRIVDGDGTHDIARTENASVDFAYPFPIPGFIPRNPGLPHHIGEWRFGFHGSRDHYGHSESRMFLPAVFGISGIDPTQNHWHELAQ